ncbi:MAG: aminotransferase class I/II-fold pyridoxal phosphate-dependent enzyme [Sulfurospirillaceae bacterium]|nr:aminotransferase class I/II-fold pyridoxal phosphate-dependent enzyme [Sulfurospirillaceae bacterium]
MMYSNELKAIKKANRFREREIYDENIVDFASNDYLGLADNPELFERAVSRIRLFKTHAPKASQLVNGYHQIHRDFEDYLATCSGFESAMVMGSGFLANLALIEALPRKKDILILDEEFHASGILASKTVDAKVVFFKHNDPQDLKRILDSHTFKRAIIAVEGIYSMSGNMLSREIFDVAEKYNALLVVDEAHSVGVLGKKLLGVFEHYQITPSQNHIKMGTLGKALGSYGAYVLCSNHIAQYLRNRAKAFIYATAPSLFDIALAHEGFLFIGEHAKELAQSIKKRQEIVLNAFGKEIDGLIFALQMQSSKEALQVQKILMSQGFLVGAIRPPTVEKPILRIIPRINYDTSVLLKMLECIKESKR